MKKIIFSGVPTIQVFLDNWLPHLSQASRINTEDAKKWYQEMARRNRYEDRFAWHFRRLSGIGGSEIGEIVQRSMGYSATFNTVEKLLDLKLMKITPDLPNNHMRRGIYLEDPISRIFKEDYKATTRRDIVDQIGSHRILALPWASGNVDDAVEIKGTLGLIDYKATSEIHDQTYLIYQIQLKLYDLILADSQKLINLNDAQASMDILHGRKKPLAFDFMLNVMFDYANGVTHPVNVPYDGDLTLKTIDAGNIFWNHVVSGAPLPEWKIVSEEAIEIVLTPEERKKISEKERQIAALKAAADKLLDSYNNERDEMSALIGDIKSKRIQEVAGNDDKDEGVIEPNDEACDGKKSNKKADKKDVGDKKTVPLGFMNQTEKTVLRYEEWETILNGLPVEQQAYAKNFVEEITGSIDEQKISEFIARVSSEIELPQNQIDLLRKTKINPEKVVEFCKSIGMTPPVETDLSVTLSKSKEAKKAIEPISTSALSYVDEVLLKITLDSKNPANYLDNDDSCFEPSL